MDRNEKWTFDSARTLLVREVTAALEAVDAESVETFVAELVEAERVFCVGVGRVLLSLQAFVKRLNHLGIHAWIVGDLSEPALRPGDLLVVGSGSGDSVVPVAIARVAKGLGARIVRIGSNPECAMSGLTDRFIRIPVRTRLGRADEVESRQIMTSLFEQSLYLLCDIVSLLVAHRKGIDDMQSLWEFHANLE